MTDHRDEEKASRPPSQSHEIESQRDDRTDDQTSRDPDIVDWDGENDPQNPRNWSSKAKVANTSLVIVLTLLTPLASSMFAPGVPQVLADFKTDAPTIAEFVVSIYILGFAVGPLIISPLSEMFGRWPVYVVCNILFFIFTIACAVADSMAQLIVFRFFAGTFGVCPVTLGGATISDLIDQEKRGVAMSLFGMGPLLGPVIGPIAGSYLAAAEGWRWTFWVIAIAYGVCGIAHFFFCRETYAPVLLEKKTRKLRIETNNPELRSALDNGLSSKERLTRAMVRPFKMLFLSPIVGMMAVYAAFVYGILYLLYTTFTFVFEQYYGFSSSNVGLTYLGSGIGMFIGLFVSGGPMTAVRARVLLTVSIRQVIMGASDKLLKSKAAKHGGEMKPEYRLLPLMATGWLCPIGLFIYGWTAQYGEQWAIPLFGTLLFGVGIITALICIQQYLIDAYTLYAASAVAANTVLRSIVGGLLPLAGLSLYRKLGLGWGNSLVAFIALGLTPVPFAFYFFGERIRKRGTVKL